MLKYIDQWKAALLKLETLPEGSEAFLRREALKNRVEELTAASTEIQSNDTAALFPKAENKNRDDLYQERLSLWQEGLDTAPLVDALKNYAILVYEGNKASANTVIASLSIGEIEALRRRLIDSIFNPANRTTRQGAYALTLDEWVAQTSLSAIESAIASAGLSFPHIDEALRRDLLSISAVNETEAFIQEYLTANKTGRSAIRRTVNKTLRGPGVGSINNLLDTIRGWGPTNGGFARGNLPEAQVIARIADQVLRGDMLTRNRYAQLVEDSTLEAVQKSVRDTLNAKLYNVANAIDTYITRDGLTAEEAFAKAMYVKPGEPGLPWLDRTREQLAVQASNEALQAYIGQDPFYFASNDVNVYKYWITQLDNKVRDSHRHVFPNPVPINSLFLVGDSQMFGPGDFARGGAKETTNCRCRLGFQHRGPGRGRDFPDPIDPRDPTEKPITYKTTSEVTKDKRSIIDKLKDVLVRRKTPIKEPVRLAKESENRIAFYSNPITLDLGGVAIPIPPPLDRLTENYDL